MNKSDLRKIIKEELKNVLTEGEEWTDSGKVPFPTGIDLYIKDDLTDAADEIWDKIYSNLKKFSKAQASVVKKASKDFDKKEKDWILRALEHFIKTNEPHRELFIDAALGKL